MASDQASTPAVEPTKVFVGNLSFKTREADLAHAFGEAGEVVSANIITRGPRSLGYGFVEMKSDEAAQKAVKMMDKKEIDGREINVEIAKPRAEQEEGERPARAARGGRRRGRGGRGGAGRGGRRPRQGGEADARPAREQKERTPSSTTLFVANLPFSVDDDGLSKIFEGLNISKAHVVRKRNGRSKGFGFVEFNNEADQQKALEAKNKTTVEERELIVKVALKENEEAAAPAEGEEAKEEKAEAASA